MNARLFAFAMMLPILGWADDVILPDVLTRSRQSGPAKFQYTETRRMELLDAPAIAQGYMLTDAEGTLVKLQLEPKRVVMAIAGQTMFYWDPEQKQRHSAPVAYGGPAAQQITVFRAILQGRLDELRANYLFAAENKDDQWTLQLTPKSEQTSSDTSSITITGDAEDKQRKIVILQTDGESTEYLVANATEGRASEYSISSLLREATGD